MPPPFYDHRLPPAVAPDANASQPLIGRYQVISELGRGGMGVVYHCHDPKLHRSVAVKVVLDCKQADADLLARFAREGHALAKLSQRGIVAVHEVGEHEGCPFLVMEFVEGETFETMLRREPVPPRRIAEVVREVGFALHHAHQEGITHRDVKPQNIMLDGQGQAQLMDFGLARDNFASQQLTETGEIMGTPTYMAPEQVDPELGGHGPWSDVYALGAVLYRALADRPVFTAGSQAGLLAKVLDEEPEPLSRVEPAVPDDLAVIAHRCLEKDPLNRYSSAADVAMELDRYLSQEPIVAQPVGARERALRWLRQNSQLSVTGVTCLVAAVVALLVVRSGPAREPVDGQLGARRHQARSGLAEQGGAAAEDYIWTREQKEWSRLLGTRVVDLENDLTPKNLKLAQDALQALESAVEVAPLGSEPRREARKLRIAMERPVLEQVQDWLRKARRRAEEKLFMESGRTRFKFLLKEPLTFLEQLGEDLQHTPSNVILEDLWWHHERLLEGDQRPGIDESQRLRLLGQREGFRRRLLRAAQICCWARQRLGQVVSEEERQLLEDIDQALSELAGSAAGDTAPGGPR